MEHISDSHKCVKEEKRKSYSLCALIAQVSLLKSSVTNVRVLSPRFAVFVKTVVCFCISVMLGWETFDGACFYEV